MLMRTQTKARD